ncbi:MAG: metallophosphoesterase family protein [candidate division Zixibacteria bacterium]|nr:metallophosphoesterase family protein [candidate division Zixibacteria bacterium]
MKIAFFSDVHANLEALKAVLSDAQSEKVDKMFFLGDAVGYGPDPNECVELIAENAETCLMGNHDYAALGLLNTINFNSYAQQAIEYTQRVLTRENKEKIADFELEAFFKEFHMVHATPEHPNQWDYIVSLEDAEENFPHIKKQICLIGHSHYPAIICNSNGSAPEIIRDTSIRLDKKNKYIVNIGSVGQPRDRNSASCYLIYNSKGRTIKLQRVSYNFKLTQEKMAKAELPEYLITRLEKGK